MRIGERNIDKIINVFFIEIRVLKCTLTYYLNLFVDSNYLIIRSYLFYSFKIEREFLNFTFKKELINFNYINELIHSNQKVI